MRLTKLIMGSGLSLLIVAIAFPSVNAVDAQTNPSVTSGSGLTLIGTHWKLIELDGKPVVHSGFESYFALKPNERRVGGSSGQLVNASADGCNRLTGSYETSGDSLRIEATTTTLLVCTTSRVSDQQKGNVPTPASPGTYVYKDNQADLFLLALKKTSGYRIRGSMLELLDLKGMVLARMEATNVGSL